MTLAGGKSDSSEFTGKGEKGKGRKERPFDQHASFFLGTEIKVFPIGRILARVQINGADGVKLRTELLENEEDEESRALELSELVAAHKRGLYIIVEDKGKELSLLGFDFSKHFDRYRVL